MSENEPPEDDNTPSDEPNQPERRNPQDTPQEGAPQRRATDAAALFNIPDTAQIDRRDDAQFQHEIKRLIERAEETRVRYMNKHQTHRMIGLTLSLFLQLGGATAFGWFFLMQPDLVKAFSALALGLILPFFLHGWIESPIHHYVASYKKDYMPELAKLLGGFSYHPDRGIGEGLLKKTGIIPAYKHYRAEDCFRGYYKGTKVLFSEAELTDKKKEQVFRGLFALIELPNAVFEGHTIMTADRDMADAYGPTRWHKLRPVPLDMPQREWDRFVAYSTQPEAAQLMIGQKLIKELAEADMAFDNANLSAVFFRKKYIFVMIPSMVDMFEASNLYVPVSSMQHSIECKREIEKILEMIDIFDIYARAPASA